MLTAIIQFAILAAIVIAAGTMLARYADAIAEATGLGRLLIGSILLAGATSLPELTVDISAVRLGLPDLAVGDLLGSSLMNILILAVIDLTSRSRGQMLSRTAAAHALSGLFGIVLTSLVGLGILTSRHVEHWTFLGAHAWVWVVGAGYAMGVRMVFLDQRIAARAVADDPAVTEDAFPHLSLPRAALGFAAAALCIVITGPYLAEAAGTIAELSGLGNTFVGTTLVALCTSLPELAASVAAVRIGAYDLVIGNVFGSNAFNMVLFLPLDLVFPGALFAAVSPAHTISAFAVVVATSLVIIGQLYHVERRIRFLEPDAIMVIVVVLAALTIIYYAG